MWTTLLVCTGTGPTSCIKSTLWSPSSLDNSRAFASETATWSHMQGSGPARCPAGGVDVWTAAAPPTPAADSWIYHFVGSRSDVRCLSKMSDPAQQSSWQLSSLVHDLKISCCIISSWILSIIILIFNLDIFQGQCLLQKHNF